MGVTRYPFYVENRYIIIAIKKKKDRRLYLLKNKYVRAKI